MSQTANLNARIIESLYVEGLMLSDEVRAAFLAWFDTRMQQPREWLPEVSK